MPALLPHFILIWMAIRDRLAQQLIWAVMKISSSGGYCFLFAANFKSNFSFLIS
jgi:hypothetical protein